MYSKDSSVHSDYPPNEIIIEFSAGADAKVYVVTLVDVYMTHGVTPTLSDARIALHFGY